MDRLTSKNRPPKGAVPGKFDIDFIFRMDDDEVAGFFETMNRLADYEDTGLTPEEVEGLKNSYPQLQEINDRTFQANMAMGKDLEKFKKKREKPPATFADQVRRMDDEALAWQFASLFVGGMGGVMEGMGMKFNTEELLTMAYPRMMAELKAPAKEE